MQRFVLRALVASLAVIASAAITSTQETTGHDLGVDRTALPTPVEGFEMVAGEVFRDGRIFIAGQPSEVALKRFHDLGVTAVINLRTPGEMENRERVPFDEATAVRELGLDYVFIPLGGDEHPYTPAAVDTFAATLEKHRGPVLVHCTVAWRASYMWVAYLIQHQDYPLDEALARGEVIGISPPPLQGLLGRKLTLAFDD